MDKLNTYLKTTQKLLVLLTLFWSTLLIGQDECTEPLGSTILEINNVKTLVTNSQTTWYDGQDALHEVPAGSGVNSFFAGGLWIAGLTPDGQINIAANQYGLDGPRFLPGPLTAGTGNLDPGICEAYNRLFTVTREMSETHIQYFESVDAGTVAEDFPNGYGIPQVLLDYPGTIYTSAGNQNGGPYADVDGDGIYNPLNGDYPLFSNMDATGGCEACETLGGDVAIFWIDNDNSPNAVLGDQLPIGIEIHNQVYAFDIGGDIGNTIFYQKKIINRGSQTLNQTYAGLWVDPDLGCADDYVACDVQRNLGIVYNGDNLDEDCGGASGYGENPPAAGLLVFQGPYKDFDGGPIETLDMSGFMAMSNILPSQLTYPQNATEYYNMLTARWADGSPLTHGGSGIGGAVETSFAYPHDSDPLFVGTEGVPVDPWSEISSDNAPGDRRFVMSFGPFTLEPGEENCISYATIFAPITSSQNPLNGIQLVADTVQEFYNDCFDGIINGIDDVTPEEFVFVHWDDDRDELSLQSIRNTETAVSVFDTQGKLVLQDVFQRETTLSISGASSGIYIVRLQSVNGAVQSERIVMTD